MKEFEQEDPSFDPDEYLASKNSANNSSDEDLDEVDNESDFDPDSYLKNKAADTVLSKNEDNSVGITEKAFKSFKDSFNKGQISPTQIGSNLLSSFKNLKKEDITRDPLASGISQGATFATTDELAGLTGALSDVALNIDDSIPGESGIEKFKRLYATNRDRERQRLKEIESSSPELYTTGDVLGSFALPIGQVSKGFNKLQGLDSLKNASTAEKLLTNAATGSILGFAEGAGRSENELNSAEFGKDIALSTGLGIGLPVAAQSLASGAKKVEGLLPEKFKEFLSKSYNLGKENIDITSPEYTKRVLDKEQKLASEASESINLENKKIQQSKDRVALKNQKILNDNSERVKKIEEDFSNIIENTRLQQISDNQANKEELAKKTYDLSKNLQTRLFSLKQNLTGKNGEYDQIYDSAKDLGIKVDTTPLISDFLDKLSTSALDEKGFNKIRDEVTRYAGDLDLNQVKQLKNIISKYSSSKVSDVGPAANSAYKNVGLEVERQLKDSGYSDLYNKLKDANKKYQTLVNMDDFVGSFNPDPVKNQMYPTTQTIKTIQNMAAKEPEYLTKSQQFKDYYSNLDDVNELIPLEQHSKELIESSNFKPEVPKLSDVLKTNSEYQNLLMEQEAIKNQPELRLPLEDKLSKFGSNPETIQENIMKMLPKFEDPLDNTVQTRRIDFLKDILSSQKGSPAADQFVKNVEDLNLERLIGQSTNPELRNMATQSGAKTNIFNVLTGGVANAANKIGRSTNDPSSFINKLTDFKNMSKTGRSGVLLNTLTDENEVNKEETNTFDSSPESLMETSMRLKQSENAHAQTIAAKLEKAAKSENLLQRNALIFSIMQDPTARSMIQNESGNKKNIIS